MNIWILAAAGACGITTLLHIFGGGATAARALLATKDMSRVDMLTNYYCWHLVTIVLAAMTAGFGWAGLNPPEHALVIGLTGLSGAFTLLSIALVMVYRVKPLALPQWLFFAVIAGLGLAGIVNA